MRLKKVLLIGMLITVIALFTFPVSLGAQEAINAENNLEELCDTTIYPEGSRGTLDCWLISSPCGQPILEVGAARQLVSGRWESWFAFSDGNFGGSTGNAWNVTGIGTDTVTICENVDGRVPDVFGAFYECMSCPKAAAEPEPEPWVRGDRDMVCYQVWVNDDNCFELVFWWEYADNNWVKIYDMEGNLVWETDMPYGDAHIEVCLPDGMYLVKTFHDQPEPLQEFYIGKPVPADMDM
jgi:hypothetical protein